MKSKLIASALLALSVAASGSAFAQRGDRGNDYNDRNDYAQRQDNDGYNRDRNNRDRYDRERNDRDRHDGPRSHGRDYRDGNAYSYYRDERRGGGPRHDLRRGQRLGHEYRDNRYVVNDWRARRLSAPPRGHHWVRAGDDYVLAAIATGLIAQVLFSN